MANTFNSFIIMSKTPILDKNLESNLNNITTTRLLSSQDIRSSLDLDMFKLHHYCTCREALVSSMAIQMNRSSIFSITHPYKKIFVYTASTLSKAQLAWVNGLTPAKVSGVLVPHSTLVSTNSIEPDQAEYIRTEFHQNNFSVPLVSFITYFTKYGRSFLPNSNKMSYNDVINSIIKKYGYIHSNQISLGFNELYVCFALYLNKEEGLFPYHYNIGGYGDFSSGISSYVSMYNSFDNATYLARFFREYKVTISSLGNSKKRYVELLIKELEEGDEKQKELREANFVPVTVDDEDESDNWAYEQDTLDSEDEDDE